ncbi:protein CMSS1 isoform X11 [Camelus ferus]|uniref:Protein CMSS1 isoform X11 n=1 Tax=Camelus ferus TaxID=419612 RepID=A0A8B8TVX9_CAMFR|nr:protein CMSS1 isoform X11 [Camelus ferus]
MGKSSDWSDISYDSIFHLACRLPRPRIPMQNSAAYCSHLENWRMQSSLYHCFSKHQTKLLKVLEFLVTHTLSSLYTQSIRWRRTRRHRNDAAGDSSSSCLVKENQTDSCFLKANDLTHSLSSYLKEICPKWVKLRKNHSEKKSVLMLIICGSAVRALELIRSMTAFRGDSKVMKLFAKHIKVQEQVKLLEKRVVHLGVGTPGRIKELIKQGGLNLNPLKFLVFDWNWRDQKLRRMMDIPEIRKEVFELLEMGVFSLCKSESLKLGLF